MIRKLLKVEFREAFSSMLPVGAGMLVLSALTALNSAVTARIRVSSAGFDWLGALLVVGNTVRLDNQGRAEEILTVQLLGATDGFVRRPFLYLGAGYGLLAGALALCLVAFVPRLLHGVVVELVSSYGSSFVLRGLGMTMVLVTLAGAMALGWLGAWLAAGHHLRRNLPEVEANP